MRDGARWRLAQRHLPPPAPQPPPRRSPIGCWMLGVGCWMFTQPLRPHHQRHPPHRKRIIPRKHQVQRLSIRADPLRGKTRRIPRPHVPMLRVKTVVHGPTARVHRRSPGRSALRIETSGHFGCWESLHQQIPSQHRIEVTLLRPLRRLEYLAPLPDRGSTAAARHCPRPQELIRMPRPKLVLAPRGPAFLSSHTPFLRPASRHRHRGPAPSRGSGQNPGTSDNRNFP